MYKVKFQLPMMALLTMTAVHLFLFTVDASLQVEEDHPTVARTNLRRQLPGNEFTDFGKMGAGVGGTALLVIIGLVVLCCLCSGRWSLCDILACVCIYEMCCDDGNIGGFRLF
jgi:hypothetical protein